MKCIAVGHEIGKVVAIPKNQYCPLMSATLRNYKNVQKVRQARKRHWIFQRDFENKLFIYSSVQLFLLYNGTYVVIKIFFRICHQNNFVFLSPEERKQF